MADITTLAKHIKSTSSITDKDLDFINLIHAVDIESDLLKSNKKTVIFTVNDSNNYTVKFSTLSEFKSYVKAWEQAANLYSDKQHAGVFSFLKRNLKRWCTSLQITQSLTKSKGNEHILRFKFKNSDTTIVLPMNAVKAYVKILRKIQYNYNKL